MNRLKYKTTTGCYFVYICLCFVSYALTTLFTLEISAKNETLLGFLGTSLGFFETSLGYLEDVCGRRCDVYGKRK